MNSPVTDEQLAGYIKWAEENLDYGIMMALQDLQCLRRQLREAGDALAAGAGAMALQGNDPAIVLVAPAASRVLIAHAATLRASPARSDGGGDAGALIDKAKIWISDGGVRALRTQRQLDMDGCEVGISRQAADEAAELIEALAALSRSRRDTKEGERSRLLREIDEYLSGHPQNAIYCGSKLHQEVKYVLATDRAPERGEDKP